MSRQFLRLSTGLWFVLALIACAVAMGACPHLGADCAYANPGNAKNLKGTIHVSHWKGDWPIVYVALDKGTISNAKSNKKKVATVKVVKPKKENGKMYGLQIKKKKAGTTKITFKYNGKKKSFKLKVHKYVNPMIKVMIGDADRTSCFDSPDTGSVSLSRDAGTDKIMPGKIQISPKKGWKIKEIVVCNESTSKWKKVKNGYELAKREYVQSVSMKHRSGLQEWYSFW